MILSFYFLPLGALVEGMGLKITARSRIAPIVMAAVILSGCGPLSGSSAGGPPPRFPPAGSLRTATPIKYLVVIFQENQSFDHYFGTYPHAQNRRGEPPFHSAPGTPHVNGLSQWLLHHNPNETNPVRLSAVHSYTCDNHHGYVREQRAFDGRRMDRFVAATEGSRQKSNQYCPRGIVMDYFDGNVVTALWTYAQHFALDDASFETSFGPSAVGAINEVAGTTGGVACGPSSRVYASPATCDADAPPPTSRHPGMHTGTLISDAPPFYDDCSPPDKRTKSGTAALVDPTIGDLLTRARITWGWFSGGFDHCGQGQIPAVYARLAAHNGMPVPSWHVDYDPDHEPFQYVASTANPHHLRPSSVRAIGSTDRANHQYDLRDFWTALGAGTLPAVSFLKAPGYANGHPGYSDPLDEQAFLVRTINRLQETRFWKQMAIVLSWDDSDGWYDHVRGPIVASSATPLDLACGRRTQGAPARCGYGPRLPYLVISPVAKRNYVDHTLTDQTSTLRFIEDNWLGGRRLGGESRDARASSIIGMFDFHHPSRRRLLLDPMTGEPLRGS